MTTLSFKYDWEPAEGVTAPELAATWARLEIEVDGHVVTRVEDASSTSSRRSIYCSLYPIAEWVAFNWWQLRYHRRFAGIHLHRSWTNGAAPPALRSHNLRNAGDGFLWPNLSILPEGQSSRLVWLADPTARGGPIRYISDGQALVDGSIVEGALADLVSSVLRRLDEADVSDTPLAREWAAVTATDDEEAAFCSAAARLGFDPYSVTDEMAELIEMVGSKLDQDILEDFLDAVRPDQIQRGVLWIRETAKRLREIGAMPSPLLVPIRGALEQPSPADRPWEKGWIQARNVRAALGLTADEPFSVEDLFTVENAPVQDKALIALGGPTAAGGAALISDTFTSPTASRFATARALWHVGTAPSSRFLLTAAHTDRQKIERAFAAELLAPAYGVEKFLTGYGAYAYADELEPVAEHFFVSPNVIRHQVENQLNMEIVNAVE